MEFRLTYDGPLLAHRDDERLKKRKLHVHDIRQKFHKQLKVLWEQHPILQSLISAPSEYHQPPHPPVMMRIFKDDGFNWLPIVNESNGLICKLDILLLRSGRPGAVLWDIDNKVKTLFDALRKASGRSELGVGTEDALKPTADEDPFYVLLEDDRLITHVSVTTDTLLQSVPNVRADEAARVVINVTVRPYFPYLETVGYA